MPSWVNEALRLWPVVAVVVAFVWGYFRLFLAAKIERAITAAVNGRFKAAEQELEAAEARSRTRDDKLESDLMRGLNSVRDQAGALGREISELTGRFKEIDSALSRHGKVNAEEGPSQAAQHLRDLVADIDRLADKVAKGVR